MKMEEISHKFVEVNNGLKLHVAEACLSPPTPKTPVVLLLHGFPEIWYSWRHQMLALAEAGYRAIAPNLRGYGFSDIPPQPENTTFSYTASDLVTLLDNLSISKVFIVCKDSGSFVGSIFVVLHQERVSGLVTIDVPFIAPSPVTYSDHLPEGFYISRWKEPGRAEADFGRFDVKTVLKNIYILFSREDIPIASENQEIMDLVEPGTPLPAWLTEDDLATYAELYKKSGFSTPLQVPYRSLDEMANYAGYNHDPKVEVPTLLINGEKNYLLKFPGMEDYIRKGELKRLVPNLEIISMPEGCHFVQEQFPEEVNQYILKFLSNLAHI